MAITFDHAVIYNGVFYPAFAPIEEKEEKAEKAVKKNVESVRKSKSRAAE